MAKTIAYSFTITGTDSGYTSTTSPTFVEFIKSGITVQYYDRFVFQIASTATKTVGLPVYDAAGAVPMELILFVTYTDGSTSQVCNVESNGTAVGQCHLLWSIQTDEPSIEIENTSSDVAYFELFVRKI